MLRGVVRLPAQGVDKVETPPWVVAARQHGVVTGVQTGLSSSGVSGWVRAGRLHPVYRGVYAYGHAALGEKGRWMAAVLAAGDGAVLAGLSAAVLWRITRWRDETVCVLVPKPRRSR